MQDARFAALGVIDPESDAPLVSRVGVAPDADGLPMALVSDLSQHARALVANPACSVLVGEVGAMGAPVTHPRLTIQATARFVRHDAPEHEKLAAQYLRHQPKAKLYIRFADFSLLRLVPGAAFLNGGFGKAFVLTPEDLAGPRAAPSPA